MRTEVKHSLTKSAWNVVGTVIGGKYKIAMVPYEPCPNNPIVDTRNKSEALEHAMFISKCFNERWEGNW